MCRLKIILVVLMLIPQIVGTLNKFIMRIRLICTAFGDFCSHAQQICTNSHAKNTLGSSSSCKCVTYTHKNKFAFWSTSQYNIKVNQIDISQQISRKKKSKQSAFSSDDYMITFYRSTKTMDKDILNINGWIYLTKRNKINNNWTENS